MYNTLNYTARTLTHSKLELQWWIRCLPSRKAVWRKSEYNAVQWRTQEFFSWGGVQQIQLRTEDRENGDLEA